MADAIVRIASAGAAGIIADLPYHSLPPEAWSNGQNVRFRDGAVEKFLGHSSVFGTPSVAPQWLLPVFTSTTSYWLYASLAKVYAWDGTNHTNITRQTAAVDVDYNATALQGWNGGVLNGVPVLNSYFDHPQMWKPVGVGTKLQALTWDAGDTWASADYKTNVIRPFRDWLIALGFDDGATYDPTLLSWSASADPGTEPATWDAADPTADAGFRPLSENSEPLIDCLPLGSRNMVYKQNMIYAMDWIGGQEIFSVLPVFREFGMLTRRCAKQFFSKHLVFAAGDVVLHDGSQAESIITKRMRRWLFNNIDDGNYEACFMVPNYPSDEMWLCFPEVGQSLCNLALVWNWKENTFGVRELPFVSHIGYGAVDPGDTSQAWDDDSGTWDADTSLWGGLVYNPTLRRLLMADPGSTLLHAGDFSSQFNAANMTSFVERKGIPYIGSDQRGQPIADLQQVKRITRLWPRITQEGAGSINVYVGAQDRIGGAVSWSAPVAFDWTSQRFVDTPDAPPGVLTAIKFESTGNFNWKLHGYDFELSVVGSAD